MLTIDRERSVLLVIDFQVRLMPLIDGGPAALANARRLLDGAAIFDIPVLLTEQNPRGLGSTVADLARSGLTVHKMAFDAVREPAFLERFPGDRTVVVAGCEAHVCVMQTVFGLLDKGKQVFVVRDALGARKPEGKEAALRRMERHGAEIVTTEMVLFEWLSTCEHSRFRDVLALVK